MYMCCTTAKTIESKDLFEILSYLGTSSRKLYDLNRLLIVLLEVPNIIISNLLKRKTIAQIQFQSFPWNRTSWPTCRPCINCLTASENCFQRFLEKGCHALSAQATQTLITIITMFQPFIRQCMRIRRMLRKLL